MKSKNMANYGDMLIRIVAGLIFIIAGYGKLFAKPGIEGFSGMLGGLGFPIPVFFAVLVGIIELAGGILLFLGVWNRIPAALLAIIMLVAIFTVHLKDGWNGYRYQLLLLVVLIRYIGTCGFCDVMSWFKKKS